MTLYLLLTFLQIWNSFGDLSPIHTEKGPSAELKRRTREWVIPPLYIQENLRGPFSKAIDGARVKSQNNKEERMVYSIIGKGVDQPPVGIFTIDRNNGQLYVTKSLDRETKNQYETETRVQEFLKSSKVLRRRKRDWVMPTLYVPENLKGPFPKPIDGAKMKSDHAIEIKMVYSITGEGVDQPPVGVFTIDRNTGQLYITKPLDREAKSKYEFTAAAVGSTDQSIKEPSMEVIIIVTDQNDNKPLFAQNPFLGSVPEASKMGFEFMTVNATDADDPETDNADIRYSIISQVPLLPNPNMFTINSVTGGIRVNSDGLDRENHPEYTLVIQAADMVGNGLVATGTAVITVTDSNDHAPQFEKSSYTISVQENKVGPLTPKLSVTDGDDPLTPAWTAKFRIVKGNNDEFFSISTGPNKQEGIITTAKPLDFEQNNKYSLLVVAENDVPFVRLLPTSTATVIVNVLDVNEAPVFKPAETTISKPEDVEIGTELTVYTATDPDKARNQTVIYRLPTDDHAGWLSVDRNTGLIRVKSPMDREASFVKDGRYKALILAVDDDSVPATGTGTLVIKLEDVNDNAPFIKERVVRVCNREPAPVLLSVADEDGPGFAGPYTVELQGDSKINWTARMNDSGTGLILTLKTALKKGEYSVVLRVSDSSLFQDNIIQASVHDCTGEDQQYLNNYFCLKI